MTRVMAGVLLSDLVRQKTLHTATFKRTKPGWLFPYQPSYITDNSFNKVNPLMPNDHYSGCTAPLTSKRCILYIYSTNTGTEYFKHGIYSQFFPLQNAVCFIILNYLVPVLFTFYIQCVVKLKK